MNSKNNFINFPQINWYLSVDIQLSCIYKKEQISYMNNKLYKFECIVIKITFFALKLDDKKFIRKFVN